MADERIDISLELRAAGWAEVRLTALATALRGGNNRIEWLARRAMGLRLPPGEFELMIGVRVQRGGPHRVPARLLPAGEELPVLPGGLAPLCAPASAEELARAEQVGVRIVAYELLTTWRYLRAGASLDSQMGQLSIPVSWPAHVLDSHGQDEAAFRARVRWLMSELMLARYGLESYRSGA